MSPPNEEVIYFNDPSGPNGTLQEGDDLKKEVKETLADYLSKLTHDSKQGNIFPIAAGSNEIEIQDNNGNPPPIELGNNGAEKIFAPYEGNHQLRFYSDSEVGTPTISELVKKGQSSNAPSTAKDGHSLLPSVNDGALGLGTSGLFSDQNPNPTNPIHKRVSSVLSQNRFTPSNAFSSVAENITDPGTISSIQREFGVYNPQGHSITNVMLRKIGQSLMFRATGEINQESDPESGDTIGALLPGEAQLGITRIDTSDLDPREVFRDLFGEDINASLESNNDQNTDSYGVLNNQEEPFTSLAPAGMIALAFALILASQIAIKAILATIGLITGGKTSKVNQQARDVQGRPFLGDYRLSDFAKSGFPPIPIPPSLLGLYEVNSDYIAAVSKGMDVFFGSDNSGGGVLGAIVSTVVGGFEKATEAPGYYAVFVRNITRSANTIANAVSNIGHQESVFDTANAVIGLVEVIRSSKIIASLNIFAQIGDKALLLEAQGFDVSKIAKGNNRISIVDSLPDDIGTRHMKSRTGDSLRLAWRGSSTPSQYLLPESIAKAGASLTQEAAINPFALGRLEPRSVGQGSVEKAQFTRGEKLDSDSVHRIETELDSEYVPFYFHDLRTNEIMSFHAFLEDISDGFTANYEKSDSYGRVEPISIYKNTERQISLSFHVVATSPNDFDEMWFKINKLITLVYPQYSKGNVMKTDNNKKFIQPFSQIISASPLIRLRLGDVFRTNYSKFSLARLFGLGTDDFDVGSNNSIPDVLQVQDAILTIQNAYDKGQFGIGSIMRLRANSSPGAIEHSLGYAPDLGEPGLLDGLGSALKSAIGIDNEIIPPLILTAPAIVEIVDVRNNGIIIKLKGLDTAIVSKPNQKYVVNAGDLFLEPADIKKAAFTKLGIDPEADSDTTQIDNFFSEANNSIVRSFKSSAGKGLAGHITSLNFSDWNNATWETEKYGGRAPQYMKITINFSPIHDISPGLDHEGFNRAPVYNIGEIMNSIAGDGDDSARAGKDFFEAQQRAINKSVNSKKS